jgi:hypothetical protein
LSVTPDRHSRELPDQRVEWRAGINRISKGLCNDI